MQSSIPLWLFAFLCISCGQSQQRLDPEDLPSLVIKEVRWSQTFCVSADECPPFLCLDQPLRDWALAYMQIDGQPVPTWSCSDSSELQECPGPAHGACPCTRTWTYTPMGGQSAPCAGFIEFADHYDPCLETSDGCIEIELIYVASDDPI